VIDLSVGIAGMTCRVDLGAPKSLTIPLRFNGPQPNFFGAPLAQVNPLQGDGYIDDMQVSNTRTQMIFIDGSTGNHRYLLNLQLRAFHSNAAPCRPLVFALNPE